MQESLAYFGGTPTIQEDARIPNWPEITPTYERVVNSQLNESISIYNRSGIIETFEEEFAKIHNSKYALLNNSGTNSIWAMFVGANLQPGDEVLCPTYTFFATNTPLLSSGLIPVFCDADKNGNLDPLDIEHRITSKTKAIIVTHMWGYPCDMIEIARIAKKHRLLLFEDCSHAHMATLNNKYVGTFGHAAAWSLQGQKNITGGEGGILLTNDEDIYVRATLLGHYNKRSKQEIREDHPLYKFAVTGMGLKMRSHPLAIAFAVEQLHESQSYMQHRNVCAKRYSELLRRYDFIEELDITDSQPSWYAYIFKFRHDSIDRDLFVEMLHKEGLNEVDIPGSTGPNHLLPLFKEPHVLFPQFYTSETHFNVEEPFTGAADFYNSIVKLPIWATTSGDDIFDKYLEGLKKVLDYVKSRSN
jgi:dTDP-4-amino-4,6-dideoxygalactose transaminase